MLSARDSRHNRALSRLRLRSQRENLHAPLIRPVIVSESERRREIIAFVIRLGPSTVTYHGQELPLDDGSTGEHHRRYDDRVRTSIPAASSWRRNSDAVLCSAQPRLIA